MIRTALLTLVTLAIAIGLGGASVWYALDSRQGVGAVDVGGWVAHPDMGTPDADPYTKARIAREGILTLGRAEGISFVAERDSGGAPLLAECSYAIEGVVPPARFWTLFAVDEASHGLPASGGRQAAIQSYALSRAADNSVAIAIGRRPRPGNWMLVNASGPMALVLTLYDTPVTAGGDLAELAMPQVLRIGCDA
ncbi:MAG: DUF1214 domain-containing protein [Rhizobiaceae bacterium]|nr:DUF1214 domain-containing protein [Rhizobiaceae bacterium]